MPQVRLVALEGRPRAVRPAGVEVPLVRGEVHLPHGHRLRGQQKAGLPTWARFTSESPGGGRRSRGGITKAGNKHLGRLLVEAAWHFANASRRAKPPARGQLVDPAVRRRALKGNRRLVDRRRTLDDAGPAVATGCTARKRHGRILNSKTSVEQTHDSAGGTPGDDI